MKLVNSLVIKRRDAISKHQDIHSNKDTVKYKVDPNKKFNYSKYAEERELEQEAERRKIRLRNRALRKQENVKEQVKHKQKNIAIVNLISDSEESMINLVQANDNIDEGFNEEFDVADIYVDEIVDMCREIERA